MDPNIQSQYNQAKEIGRQFLEAFLGKGPVTLSNFYAQDSILTFETEQFSGTKSIVEKLNSINLSCSFSSYEVQPSINSLVILVQGNCQISGEMNLIPFMRVFVLCQNNGQYYIKNDIYKISLA